jgi:hypothetical protein
LGYLSCIQEKKPSFFVSLYASLSGSTQNLETDVSAVKKEITDIMEKKETDFDELNNIFLKALALLNQERNREEKEKSIPSPFKDRYDHAKSFYNKIIEKKIAISSSSANLAKTESPSTINELPSSAVLFDITTPLLTKGTSLPKEVFMVNNSKEQEPTISSPINGDDLPQVSLLKQFNIYHQTTSQNKIRQESAEQVKESNENHFYKTPTTVSSIR